MSIDEVMAGILEYGILSRRATVIELRSFRTSIKAAIEQHVAEAVKAEREACADIAREWEDVFVIEDSAPRHVDEVIRARGTP